MRWLLTAACGAAVLVTLGSAQTPPPASEAEKQELAAAIQEAQTSPQDTIRVLEEHLRRYPQTSLRREISKLMTEAAIEANDRRRTALYGVPALAMVPNDAHLLARVADALLDEGGRENAKQALDYATRLEDYLIKVPVPRGMFPVRNQEDRDRAISRALLHQARAHAVLGDDDAARLKAALSYIAYPSEMPAREWARALNRLGRRQEAVEKMADAFVIDDPGAGAETRAADRRELGEIYRSLHGGSETGLGDVILGAYDRTAAELRKRRDELRKLDPNHGLTEASQFTLLGIADEKLELPRLRGKVLILDFWATWCIPCRAQHPLYEEVKRALQDRDDVMFLSVNADEDHGVVIPFLEEQKWSKNVYYESGLARLLGVTTIPATIIIDKEGRIASRMNGFVPDTFVRMLTNRIRSVLAGPVEGPR